jgi:DNA end-binding protein Ku
VARSIWKGSVSFGLVNIPVRLYTAVREHKTRFHQLAPDGSQVHLKRVSEKTGREVDYDKIKKGYELSKGKFVAFEPDELDALQPPSMKIVEIDAFVERSAIDPVYFDKTYHVAPDGETAAKAYSLLAAVMDEGERVAIGTFVMRERQHLAAIWPSGKGLALSTLHYADEIVPQSDVDGIPTKRVAIGAREKKMALQILDSLSTGWKPEAFHDTYEEQLKSVIRKKAKGVKIEPPAEPESDAKVLDLMEALNASLERGAKRKRTGRTSIGRKSTGRKSAGRKAAGRKRATRKSA